jgi:hypothetical protein
MKALGLTVVLALLWATHAVAAPMLLTLTVDTDHSRSFTAASDGTLRLPHTMIEGVAFEGNVTQRIGKPDVLSLGLAVRNTTDAEVTVYATLSAHAFAPPVNWVELAAEGTFENTPDSVIDLEWYDLPNGAYGFPGTQVGGCSAKAKGDVSTFSCAQPLAKLDYPVSRPFTMVEEFQALLAPGGSLILEQKEIEK